MRSSVRVTPEVNRPVKDKSQSDQNKQGNIDINEPEQDVSFTVGLFYFTSQIHNKLVLLCTNLSINSELISFPELNKNKSEEGASQVGKVRNVISLKSGHAKEKFCKRIKGHEIFGLNGDG